jgi:hypothetical protein
MGGMPCATDGTPFGPHPDPGGAVDGQVAAGRVTRRRYFPTSCAIWVKG